MKSNSTNDVISIFDEDVVDSMKQIEKSMGKPGFTPNYFNPQILKDKTSRALEVRFLPNIQNGKKLDYWVEENQHYVKLGSELDGYISCAYHAPGDKCPLCTKYWSLKKSTVVADQERAAFIARSTKYYSYALIISDTEGENVGKIVVLRYSYQIYEKIKQSIDGLAGEKVNPFSPLQGCNLKLILSKNKGGFTSYSSSFFLAPSKVDASVNELYFKTIDNLPRLESFKSKPWDAETKDKVEKVLSYFGAHKVGQTVAAKHPVQVEVEEDDDFFNIPTGD